MIENAVYRDPTIQFHTKKAAVEAAMYWKSLHPPLDESGAYRDSIKVTRRPEQAFKKLPQFRVGAEIWYAHFIEFGTGPDKKGKSPRVLPESAGREHGNYGFSSPPNAVTKNTPTPEYALAAKTAHRFFGTPDYGLDDSPVSAAWGVAVDFHENEILPGTEHIVES